MKNDPNHPTSDRACDPLDELLRSARWPDDASDPLDRLLRMAQWPEPTTSSIQHARPQKGSLLPLRRGKRRMAWTVAGMATAVAFFVALTLWCMRLPEDRSSGEVPATVARTLTLESAVSARPAVQRDSHPSDAQKASLALQALRNTISETTSPAILQATRPGELYRRMLSNRNRVRSVPADGDVIDRLLAQRIADPDGDLQDLSQPLLAERAQCEARLLERFNTFAGAQEAAAIELLSCVGSEASVPLLMQLSHKPATHAPAVRALLKIAGTKTLARLAFNEWNPDLREEITAALRARGDEQTAVFVLATQGEQSCSKPGSASWQHAESL